MALSLAGELVAQDFHLTQFEAAPQYLNPALTGIYFKVDADYRVNANYRAQWQGIASKPYSTISVGYDQPFKNRWGLGGFIINNRSGIGHFNTFSGIVSGAYRIIDDPTHTHNLSVGLQMGLLSKSYDPSKFLFEEQYSVSAGGLDPNQSSGEFFEKNSIVRFDANLGIFYKYISDNWYHPFAGFSVYHITMPNESFTSFKRRLPMHFIGNLGCDMDVNEKLRITPSLLYMNQAQAQEIVFNVLAVYHIEDTDFDAIGGLGYRNKDAMMFHIGLKYFDHVFRFSYDLNTSYLNQFSRGGAWEFSVIYYVRKKGQNRTRKSIL